MRYFLKIINLLFCLFSASAFAADFQATQIELGAGYETLSKNSSDWRSEYVSFDHRFASQQSIYGTVLQTERFQRNDVQFLLGGYYPLSSDLLVNVEGNISPTANILAKNSVLASLQGNLSHGFFLTGGFRHSEYGTGALQQGIVTLENYFSDFRVAYTLRVSHSNHQTVLGHTFDASYYYDDRSFVSLSYGMGTQTGGYQGTLYDTQSFGLHGRHWLNQQWAITWEAGYTQQGHFYDRQGGSLGIRYAF